MALPAMMLVHATSALCAVSCVLPLAAVPRAGDIHESAPVDALYVLLKLVDAFIAAPRRYLGLPVLLLGLLTPFLRVLWFCALTRRAPLHDHGQHARQRYLPALGVCVMCLGFQVMLAGAGWLVAHAAAYALELTHDLRLRQCVALLAATPFAVLALLVVPAISDLAHAQLAQDVRSLRSVLEVALRRIDARTCLVRAACDLALVLTVVLSLTQRLWLPTGVQAMGVALVLSQLQALGQTLLRACWCAWLVQRQSARCVLVLEPIPAPLS